jgi:hypothetical protein
MRRCGVAIAIATMMVSSSSLGQRMQEGRVYIFHSKETGQCPGLDWHLVVGPDNKLSGIIAWDDMKAVAKASGTVDPNHGTFTMNAKEISPMTPWPVADCPPRCPPEGQGRRIEITGTVGADGWLKANIKGPNIDCQGINVPWFVVPSSKGGD